MAYDPLCTVNDVKLWLRTAQDDTGADAQIGALIPVVSRLIGRFCGRDNLGAVLTYVERHPPKRMGLPTDRTPRVFLRRFPVVALTQVSVGSGALAVPVTTDPAASTGALLDEDQRTVMLLGVALNAWSGPVVVTYSAGYVGEQTAGAVTGVATTIPEDLTQCAVQWIGEILKSRDFIGFKSQTLAGQTVAYEDGRALGMSPRTKAMLQPHVNRAPAGNY